MKVKNCYLTICGMIDDYLFILCLIISQSWGVSFLLQEEAHLERIRWDRKDGELCLAGTKSGETLMEVRSDSDVQMDRRSWVLGRKTNRTI